MKNNSCTRCDFSHFPLRWIRFSSIWALKSKCRETRDTVTLVCWGCNWKQYSWKINDRHNLKVVITDSVPCVSYSKSYISFIFPIYLIHFTKITWERLNCWSEVVGYTNKQLVFLLDTNVVELIKLHYCYSYYCYKLQIYL